MDFIRVGNLIWSWWYRWKCDLREWIGKHAPKIQTRKPKAPGMTCKACKKPFTKIVAYNTGDGWALAWECVDGCGYCADIENWWPFMFGAYCNANDLRKAGIEVI